MGQTLFFGRVNAYQAGVRITPETQEGVVVGYRIETPTGIVGYSDIPNGFDCKINQELRRWFLDNVKTARVSY